MLFVLTPFLVKSDPTWEQRRIIKGNVGDLFFPAMRKNQLEVLRAGGENWKDFNRFSNSFRSVSAFLDLKSSTTSTTVILWAITEARDQGAKGDKSWKGFGENKSQDSIAQVAGCNMRRKAIVSFLFPSWGVTKVCSFTLTKANDGSSQTFPMERKLKSTGCLVHREKQAMTGIPSCGFGAVTGQD